MPHEHSPPADDTAVFSLTAEVLGRQPQHPALDWLQYHERLDREIFAYQLDAHQKIKAKGAGVPWAYSHLAFSQHYVREALPHLHRGNQALADHLANTYAGLGAWRMTKGIYEFHPELFDALTASKAIGSVPGEVLKQLPEWGVFIRTPGLTFAGKPTYGYWAWLEAGSLLEFDYPDTISFLFITPGELNAYSLRLDHTLDESFAHLSHINVDAAARIGMDEERQHEIRESTPEANLKAFRQELPKHLSLLLYICSENADVKHRFNDALTPRRPVAKKTKKGTRLFPAPGPQRWQVGVRVGAELRRGREQAESEAAAEGGGRSVRPHVRGAHWHLYWTGPRNEPDKRKPILKWLPPTYVNFDPSESEELPAVRKSVNPRKG